MIVSLSMLRRKAGTREEFHARWSDSHAPLAARLPGLRKYVQNRVIADLPKATRRGNFIFDGFGFMWFDDISSMQRSFSSGEQEKCTTDLTAFTAEVRLVT